MFNAYGVGGTLRTVFTMVEQLSGRHDIEIVSMATGTRDPFFRLPAGVRSTVLEDRTRPPRGWTARSLLERVLRRMPSVLWQDTEGAYPHVSLWIDVQLVRFLGSVDADVLVATRHGLNVLLAQLAPPDVGTVGQMHTPLYTQHPDLQAAVRKHCPRLDVLVVLSREEERFSRDLFGSTLRIARIPNAVPASTARLASTDGTDIIAVGRLESRKGFDLLIEAYARLVGVRPDWSLRIFGQGPDRDSLQRLIDERGLQQRVHLMGPSSAVADEMSKASLYVMSSRVEGFPMVLLEAMGVGLPVISFDCPYGPNELIEHGENGLLVPAEDVEALAAAMLRMTGDQEARRMMGRRALESVGPFRPEVIAEEWAELFGGLVRPARVSLTSRGIG